MPTTLLGNAFAASLLVIACSEGAGTPAHTPPEGAAGADASGGSGGSGGQFDSLPTAVTWKVLAETEDGSLHMNVPAAASRGDQAAVAYVETSFDAAGAAGPSRVLMQRFDAAGERMGSPLVLGTDVSGHSNTTLASDGTQYTACWSTESEIHCALADGQGHLLPSELAIPGQSATIVATADGWALAYVGSDRYVRLQALSPTLALRGDDVTHEIFAQSSADERGPLFVTTPSGFALVGSREEGKDADLLQLSADLKSVVSTIPLEHGLWHGGQLVASEARAAVSLSSPYGSYLLLLDRNRLAAELGISGGGKTGMDSGLLILDGGVGAAWLDRDGTVRRRFFADGREAELGFAMDEALLGGAEEGSDSYQQLLRVADRTLLVARADRYGFFKSAPLRVASLQFP